MGLTELGLTAVVAFLIGGLIGSIGIGGVLLAPWLTHVVGMPVRDAIVISSFAFIGPGIAALAILLRTQLFNTVQWPLVLAVIPGALLGAWFLARVPAAIPMWTLAALTIGVGAKAVLGRVKGLGDVQSDRATFRPGGLMGAFTGFASALTGTGGPMVMVPLLVWLGTPIRSAILLGQAVQLPIALSATAGNFYLGGVDIVVGTAIGVVLVPGAFLGNRLSKRVPLSMLNRLVGLALIAAGIGFAFKAVG